MVRRRVAAPATIGGDLNQFADPEALQGLLQLSQLQSLSGEEAPAVNDLMGTSQDPQNFNEIAPVPQYRDQTQEVPDDYLMNMQRISQLPLAMSGNDDLSQDAAENLKSYQSGRQVPSPISPQNAEGMIPTNAQGNLKDPLEALRQRLAEEPELASQLPETTRNSLETSEPSPEKPFSIEGAKAAAPEVPMSVGAKRTVPPEQEIPREAVENFPNSEALPGAVEQGIKDNLIQQDLQRLSGLQDPIPQDVLDSAIEWQNVMTGRLDTLNEKEKLNQQKLETGDLTTFDKIAIGIALAIPALLTLRYGAGAGLAAAGKGLENFGKTITEGKKGQKERASQALKQQDEIEKERIDLRQKSVEMDKKLLDAIPDKDARKFLNNKRVVNLGDKIGISTGDESGILWLDGQKFDASDEGVKRAREVIKDADEIIGVVKDSNRVVDEVIDVIDALPNDVGVWDAIKANWQWFTSAGGKNPFGASKTMIKVTDADGKVKEVDALNSLKQKVMNLQDVYNKQVLGGSRLTGNVITHWGGILKDPAAIESWFSQDKNSFKDTAEGLKDIMNNREVESLVGKGFLRQPLQQAFPGRERQILQSDESVINQIRNNPQAYSSKVK
jgi:hypothetical protein